MSSIKKNYGETPVTTERNVHVTRNQVEQIAAAGSIVFIKGTPLWKETH